MPLPPFLISASALLCERILQEEDKVLSAIRIIDVIYVPQLPASAPEGSVTGVQEYCLIILKAQPGHQGKHLIEFRMLNPKGELTNISEPIEAEFKARPEFGKDVPGGATVSIQLNLAVKNYGTCYICVYLDGEEITRAPFTLLQQAEKNG